MPAVCRARRRFASLRRGSLFGIGLETSPFIELHRRSQRRHRSARDPHLPGGYSGCVGWLQTPYPTNPYKTSAHYVVRKTAPRSPLSSTKATPRITSVRRGRQTNQPTFRRYRTWRFSYQGTNKWTEGQVSASAKLSCDVVKRNRIPRDRKPHHRSLSARSGQPRRRPGRDFPWADYMNRISRCVGGSTAIVVDSNQANNDASGKIDTPSSSWTSSTNVAGYYGSGYYVAPTAAVSDAVF